MINSIKLFNSFMIIIKPFYQLARYDKPIGYKLLMWPCLWSYTLAAALTSKPLDIKHIILFILGSIIMRGAGCTWNDYLDKKYDARVERTKNRPLAAKKISSKEALIFLATQLSAGFLILIQFNLLTILIGLLSILPITIYPLMKRITWWPQLFLGVTFNWGAIIGWTALANNLSASCLILYFGSIFWTIGYDTIYAHQDKRDDDFLGLKSSAIFLGDKSKLAISSFYLIFFTAISFLSIMPFSLYTLSNVLILIAIAFHLTMQVYFLDINNPKNCYKIFKSNNSIGLMIFILFFSKTLIS